MQLGPRRCYGLRSQFWRVVTSGLVGVYQHYQYRPERKTALLARAEHVATLVGLAKPAAEQVQSGEI